MDDEIVSFGAKKSNKEKRARVLKLVDDSTTIKKPRPTEKKERSVDEDIFVDVDDSFPDLLAPKSNQRQKAQLEEPPVAAADKYENNIGGGGEETNNNMGQDVGEPKQQEATGKEDYEEEEEGAADEDMIKICQAKTIPLFVEQRYLEVGDLLTEAMINGAARGRVFRCIEEQRVASITHAQLISGLEDVLNSSQFIVLVDGQETEPGKERECPKRLVVLEGNGRMGYLVKNKATVVKSVKVFVKVVATESVVFDDVFRHALLFTAPLGKDFCNEFDTEEATNLITEMRQFHGAGATKGIFSDEEEIAFVERHVVHFRNKLNPEQKLSTTTVLRSVAGLVDTGKVAPKHRRLVILSFAGPATYQKAKELYLLKRIIPWEHHLLEDVLKMAWTGYDNDVAAVLQRAVESEGEWTASDYVRHLAKLRKMLYSNKLLDISNMTDEDRARMEKRRSATDKQNSNRRDMAEKYFLNSVRVAAAEPSYQLDKVQTLPPSANSETDFLLIEERHIIENKKWFEQQLEHLVREKRWCGFILSNFGTKDHKDMFKSVPHDLISHVLTIKAGHHTYHKMCICVRQNGDPFLDLNGALDRKVELSNLEDLIANLCPTVKTVFELTPNIYVPKQQQNKRGVITKKKAASEK